MESNQVPEDEQQPVEDTISENPEEKSHKSVHDEPKLKAGTITPHRIQKLNVYGETHDTSRIRGLETSGMTYDKENI